MRKTNPLVQKEPKCLSIQTSESLSIYVGHHLFSFKIAAIIHDYKKPPLKTNSEPEENGKSNSNSEVSENI